MKIAIIKERKNPPDKRVVFSPKALVKLKKQFPDLEILVESSDVRIFSDDQYKAEGFLVTDNISDADIMIGVKEVPIDDLIPNKKYFFFSHTIKKQAHNQKLLQACLSKNIELYDHETIVDQKNNRLIGFGRFAGIVGAYNAFRAFGQKFELFKLPKAENLPNQSALVKQIKKQILPPIKIVLTGTGKVANGASEILSACKIKRVAPQDFLSKIYTEPVYSQIEVLDYYKRIDGQKFEKYDFYKNPSEYVSNFERFSKVADILITGHFYGNGAPQILSQEMLKSTTCKIKIVADISCDVDGPIACTLRSSSIADPYYGYLPKEHIEVDMFHPSSIVVMAVDNLPCELPTDASEGFGEMFLEHVIPAFFNNDKDGILKRAAITKNGKLTERFSYLEDYANQKVEIFITIKCS
jgi:alanine dehydrogenase